MKNEFVKKIIVVFLALIILCSAAMIAVFATKTENRNAVINAANNTDDIGISPASIIIGTGGDGSMSDPYTDSAWNGRAKSSDSLKDGSSANYYIDINIDPRNGLFGDDIVIEYRHYSKSANMGFETNEKLLYFEAKVQYYDKNGNFLVQSLANKSNDSAASFIRNSGKTNVEGVRVQVYVRGGQNGTVERYFFYRFGSAPGFNNYI